MDSSSESSAPLGDAQTCSQFIAAVSAREMPDNHNVQMCVLSVGFDCEGVVAALLHARMRQGPRRVYCVVVPDNLPPGSVNRMARSIERHLQRSAAKTEDRRGGTATTSTAAAVVAVEEGTGTKERCAVFQRGAVVLLTSRSLCADLLHRRLAVELVGAAVLLLPHALVGGSKAQEALAPQTAFCAELLLRSSKVNSAGLTNTERHTPPPIVILSDAPMLMQSLVQRHHMGAERFVQQLHVGDIQLFPRFRLDFVRHFEVMTRRCAAGGRPLEVDRVVAPVSPSVLALDGLLGKIVLETLQELQRLEAQQELEGQRRAGQLASLPGRGIGSDGGTGSGQQGWTPAARRAAAAAAADEDAGATRFMPRARLSASPGNGHLDYSGHPRSTAEAPPTSYVRRGWRLVRDEKGIWFGGIGEADALAVDFSDLDSDLRAVVRRHESQWSFRLLTESLIDVRRLRRAARGTPFSFLLSLEAVLERRLPQRSVYGTGVRPPAALWTLSSHFNDVVTVATHRIGTVVYRPRGAPAATVSAAREEVVVVDSSDDTEDISAEATAEARAPPPPSAALQVPQLMPNTEEQETDVEVVVRLVNSWCRTALRRRQARSRIPAATSAEATSAQVPTLLLLTFGGGAVVRYTERLTHDRDVYQQLQLRRFMHVYQAKYGVELLEYTEEEQQQAEVEAQLKASLLAAVNPEDAFSDDEEHGGAEDGEGGAADADLLLGGRKSQQSQQRNTRSSSGGAVGDVSALYGDGGSAFHQALLSQVPPVEAAATAAPANSATAVQSEEGETAVAAAPLHLAVERVRAGAVTLRPSYAAPTHTDDDDGAPRVLIFDGGQLSATEVTMLLEGSHEALAYGIPPSSAPGVDPESSPQSDVPHERRLSVDRIIMSHHHLSILRQLEMAQDELAAERLRRVKVQLITTSLAEVDFKKAVQAEQVAFESLAHTKATLTGTLLVDQSSLRQTEAALESGLSVARRRGIVRNGTAVARISGQHFGVPGVAAVAAPPCIIFDEREFRSTLPYDLFRRGVDLVPLTLTTADYVLSPDYAVERKAVADYLQSVATSRIQHQFAALSRRYAHPLCLLEFHRGIPFRLLQARIYGRTARLMASYPRVCFIWARSPAHAAGMLVSMKKSVARDNADPSDPSLTSSAMDPGGAGEASGLAATAAEREAAHYAARVLSRFPGITPQNAPRVMQLCGSLIGLATISQASLATVMDEEDAARLHAFLHTPFHERVEE